MVAYYKGFRGGGGFGVSGVWVAFFSVREVSVWGCFMGSFVVWRVFLVCFGVV